MCFPSARLNRAQVRRLSSVLHLVNQTFLGCRCGVTGSEARHKQSSYTWRRSTHTRRLGKSEGSAANQPITATRKTRGQLDYESRPSVVTFPSPRVLVPRSWYLTHGAETTIALPWTAASHHHHYTSTVATYQHISELLPARQTSLCCLVDSSCLKGFKSQLPQ